MRGAVGLASIITAHYASWSTDSWSPKGRRFPPQDLIAPLNSKCLPYPVVTDPEAPPLRPQRQSPTRSRPSTAERFTQSARLCCRDVLHVRAISRQICAEICDAVRLRGPASRFSAPRVFSVSPHLEALVTPYSVGVLNGRGAFQSQQKYGCGAPTAECPLLATRGFVCPEAASVTERAAVPSKLRAPAEGVHD